MAKQLQLRRGTTAANDLFTGADGEVTVDTTNHSLRVHNGSTQGGYLVDTVVAFQRPSIDNNYTWYRKYASGWVEQGGVTDGGTYNSPATITMPITMNDTNYCLVLGVNGQNQYSTTCAWKNKTTTTFQIENGYNGSNAAARITNWQVSGMAA